VTVIGQTLPPAALSAVTGAIADGGGNIDRIVRLARYPVVSYEFVVVAGDIDRMRASLVEASRATASTSRSSASRSNVGRSGWSSSTSTRR
jgi:hypothetical protein